MSGLKINRPSKDVVELVLNRPELHNAFNAELISDLTKAALDLAKEQDLRLVEIRGEGPSFCAGADLNWMKSMKNYSEEENYQDAQKLRGVFEALNQLPVPVLGLAHGHALGGGVGLLSVCDYVLASETALFGLTEVRLGLIPAVISPFVFAKTGESASRAYWMSGERFSAKIALAMNLVHEVVAPEQFKTREEELRRSFLMAAPHAAREAKRLIHLMKTEARPGDETCRRIAKLRISDEGQEGMAALLEKRKPKWVK